MLMTMSPKAKGWGEGWPTDRRDDTVAVTGGGVTVRVHKEIAVLVVFLLNETVRLGYTIRQADTGGFLNRAMKSARGLFRSAASWHSWGLALDINWQTNGFGRRATSDLPANVIALWEAHGFKWGGRWRVKDYMHFQFEGTPADAARITALITEGQVPSSPLAPKPTLIPPRPTQTKVKVDPMVLAARNANPLPNGRTPFYRLDLRSPRECAVLAYNGAPLKRVDGNMFGVPFTVLPTTASDIVGLAWTTAHQGVVVCCADGSTYDVQG
jgi:hypothetical protein